MKRILSLALALLLCLVSLPVTALAAPEAYFATLYIQTDALRPYRVYVTGEDILFSAQDLAVFSLYTFDEGDSYIELRRGHKHIELDKAALSLELSFSGDPDRRGHDWTLSLSEEQVKHDEASGTWYLSGTLLLPLLGLGVTLIDEYMTLLPAPVSFWELTDEFDALVFEIQTLYTPDSYTKLSETLGENSKWQKASAYLQANGISLWRDGVDVPGSDGKWYNLGESYQFEVVFADMIKDVTCVSYTVEELCKNTSLFQPLTDLVTEGGDASALPAWLASYSAYAEVADTFEKVADIALYWQSLGAAETLRWEQLEFLSDPALAAPVPMKAAADKILLGRDHPFWSTIEHWIDNIADDSLKSIASLGLKDGVGEKIAGLLELNSELHMKAHEGIARLDSYDVLAQIALDEIARGFDMNGATPENLRQMESVMALHLYARAKNLQTLADLCRRQNRADLAEPYEAAAEAARVLEGKILLARDAAYADGMQNPDPTMQDACRALFAAAPLVHLECTAPAADQTDIHARYRAFLADKGWLQSVSYDPYAVDPDFRDWGWYGFHDIDRNGTDELILVTGTAIADACCQVFTTNSGSIRLLGCVDCSLNAAPIVSSHATGLYLAEYHGGESHIDQLEIRHGKLIRIQSTLTLPDLSVPEGWEAAAMQPVCDLLPQDIPAPDLQEPMTGGSAEIFVLSGRMSFIVPATWLDRFTVVESEMGFSVHENTHMEMGYGGQLFYAYLSGYSDESQIVEENYKVVGTWAGGLVLAVFPLQVEAAYDQPELAEAFYAMSMEAYDVAETLRIHD